MIGGEAGIGKTALVRHMADRARARGFEVLDGAADGLGTPRPLGPIRDIAAESGDPRLLQALEGSSARHEILAACLELIRGRGALLVVLEDLHWTDDATCDVLRFLCRRLETTSTVVLATYRDEELDGRHPLQLLIGDLSASKTLSRLTLPPLSAAAVTKLAGSQYADVDELYRRTGGNPFFVTEVLAAGGKAVPAAIRDAVLARAARLTADARAVLDAAAIVPPRIEFELLRAICPTASTGTDECQRRGMLIAEGGHLRFRHELARSAIESELTVGQAVSLHRLVLDWLRQNQAEPDVTRLAHHAVAGLDAAAVVEYAPLAARRAAQLGAHREAAEQYAAAVRSGESRLSQLEVGMLVELQADEYALSGLHREALPLLNRALAIWQAADDLRRCGETYRRMAASLVHAGRGREARAAAEEAIRILEGFEPGPELARALAARSRLAMRGGDSEATLEYGMRAIKLAEEVGADVALIDALINVGTSQLEGGDPSGRTRLDQAISRATAIAYDDAAGRAMTNLATAELLNREYARARRTLERGIAYADEHGLDAGGAWMRACQARLALEMGDLDSAATAASSQLRGVITQESRAIALTVLGAVRARRGDPQAWAVLDEAWTIAEGADEIQFLGPAAAARVEASLLTGEHLDRSIAAARKSYEVAAVLGLRWFAGELAVWLSRAGVAVDRQDFVGPWNRELAGDIVGAADAWRELGCPYEAAMCAAWSNTTPDDARREALTALQRLGARQAVLAAGRRMRLHGTRNVPRGAIATTIANPAGLTRRELDVLRLVADGLSNTEIARRMFLSPKTVDHHVSSLLDKLGVHSRAAAAAEARRRGILSVEAIDRETAAKN